MRAESRAAAAVMIKSMLGYAFTDEVMYMQVTKCSFGMQNDLESYYPCSYEAEDMLTVEVKQFLIGVGPLAQLCSELGVAVKRRTIHPSEFSESQRHSDARAT